MISEKLRKIFYIALVLIYVHVIEELLTGFQHTDSFMIIGGNLIGTIPEGFYWILHTIWLLGVPAIYYFFRKSKNLLPLALLFGLVFFVEFHHLIKGLMRMEYYSGIVTSLAYPVLGFFYWKQIFVDWKERK